MYNYNRYKKSIINHTKEKRTSIMKIHKKNPKELERKLMFSFSSNNKVNINLWDINFPAQKEKTKIWIILNYNTEVTQQG